MKILPRCMHVVTSYINDNITVKYHAFSLPYVIVTYIYFLFSLLHVPDICYVLFHIIFFLQVESVYKSLRKKKKKRSTRYLRNCQDIYLLLSNALRERKFRIKCAHYKIYIYIQKRR